MAYEDQDFRQQGNNHYDSDQYAPMNHDSNEPDWLESANTTQHPSHACFDTGAMSQPLPAGTGDSTFEATQHQSQAVSAASEAPPPLIIRPLVPPPEEHWATLIPDTANPDCPRIEIKGTQEKVKHVIGRRPVYANKRKERVNTDTVIKHTVVSGTHCMIWREWDPDAPGDPSLAIAYLEDYSTNGTFVNGVKVRKERIAIGDGDDISLGQIVEGRELAGEFRFRFQLEYAKSERSQRRNPNDAGGLFLKYDIRGQIGSGSFARVHRAVCKKTGEWSAVKIIDKKRFKHNAKTMFMLQREVSIMQALDNPYIVKFYEGFEDDDTLWLVIEYVSGGDLLDFVINKGGLSEYEASDVALQVCEAMSYLHQQGVAHRDLKPENILMTKGPQPRCKIADFGLAKNPGSETFLKTMCGTPTYLAPEVILQGPDRPGYGFQVDAWSVGVIIYSCLANASPFVEDEALPLAERIACRVPDLQLLVDMGCSAEGVDFVARFMIHDPGQRMTVHDAILHPWLFVHRQERALTKRQTSLSRISDSTPSSSGSQQRRRAIPAGRQLTSVASSRVTPPPSNGYNNNPPIEPSAPDSAQAPASAWSSMGSLSRSHTMTDDEKSDVVSEAPSYSQRMQRLRIESDFETSQDQYQEPIVIQDSQESSNDASKASLLGHEEFSDFTPPARSDVNVDSAIYSQAGMKRKLPTSAFSSDESMQSAPNGSLHVANGSRNTSSEPATAVNGAVMQRNGSQVEPTELSNDVLAKDFAPRGRRASSASSDSSLSPLEDDESPPKTTPKTAPLKAKSASSTGRRSGSSTPRTAKAASQGPARRSTRLSAAHTTAGNYAESESDDGKVRPSRGSGRARKQQRLSAQPSG